MQAAAPTAWNTTVVSEKSEMCSAGLPKKQFQDCCGELSLLVDWEEREKQMNLQQLNEKYHGRPIELGAWKHPMFGTPPNMGFSIEARFSDGKFYNLRATLVVEGMELPHQMRDGKGVFGMIKDVRLTDGYENVVEGAGDRFADDLEALIAPLFGLPESNRVFTVRNNVCPWDITEVIERKGNRSELDAAWEKVKRELVHYIACKFDLPEPEDLSEFCPFDGAYIVRVNGRELPSLPQIRARFERIICAAYPSWTRSQSWVDLRNEMLDQVFARIGIILPPQAHELVYMANGRKPKEWNRIVEKVDASKVK